MAPSVVAREGARGRVKAAVAVATSPVPGRGPWLHTAVAISRAVLVARNLVDRNGPVGRVNRLIGRVDIDTLGPARLGGQAADNRANRKPGNASSEGIVRTMPATASFSRRHHRKCGCGNGKAQHRIPDSRFHFSLLLACSQFPGAAAKVSALVRAREETFLPGRGLPKS